MGTGGIVPHILTIDNKLTTCSLSWPMPLYFQQARSTHYIWRSERLVGIQSLPESGTKNFCPCRESNSGRPAHSTVTVPISIFRHIPVTSVNITVVAWKLICVPHVFPHAECKHVVRTALSPTVFVWQNFLKCNFSEFSFCHATSLNIRLRHFIIFQT
jgi:hypothetical protein